MKKKGRDLANVCCSGNDYTHTYGATKYEGNLTPFLANSFKSNVQTCILDGEMVGYNAETKTIGTNGRQILFRIPLSSFLENSIDFTFDCLFFFVLK